MRSLEEIVAEGKRVAANRDQIAAAGKAAKDAAERAELGKHWKHAVLRLRELRAEYVTVKEYAVTKDGATLVSSKEVPESEFDAPPKLTLEQMQERLIGYNVATAAVEKAAALNKRNKTLDQLARELRRECSCRKADLDARREAK